MTSKTVLQPRTGLAVGALLFSIVGVFQAIIYVRDLLSGEPPSAVSVVGVVLGLTATAILGYWAARFDASKKTFTRKDKLLTVALALSTGSSIALALWFVAGENLS